MARYGLASGAIERTSIRAERAFPIGMRIMAPRSIGDAFNLVRRFVVRIKTPIRIDARIEDQTEIPGVMQNTVDETPAKRGNAIAPGGVVEQVRITARNRQVGMHSAAIDAGDRFGKETRRHAHLMRHLATDQFVDQHLIGGNRRFGVRVVHLEL